MTPLLLALGVYCNFMLGILCSANPSDSEDGRLVYRAFTATLAGAIYFWIKVSDLIFGWSA